MTRIRERLAWGLVAALSLLVIAALAGVVRGGPLDPTGPPGSTGKTVITSLPFTISQEGSYVLNGNLTGVVNQNGVTVAASNVTIDLQGFELIGVNNSLAGISASNSFANVAVRNGTVRGWAGAGISLAGLVSQIEDVRVHSNGGIGISTGANSSVLDSVATTNGGAEIVVGAGSTLENCTAEGNGTAGNGIELGTGTILRSCLARNNGGTEIYASGDRVLIEDCVVDGGANPTPPPFGGPGDGIRINWSSVVRGCDVLSNAQSGIFVNGRANRLENNHVNGNDGIGIYLFELGNTGTGNSANGNLGGNCFVSSNNDFATITSTSGATNPWSNLC